MKKLALLVAASLFVAGCATPYPTGMLFTDVKLPMGATSNSGGAKIGTASCSSILSLVATGDCSLEAAMKDGGIKKVTSVDWKANNILGIIGNYSVVVRGE